MKLSTQSMAHMFIAGEERAAYCIAAFYRPDAGRRSEVPYF